MSTAKKLAIYGITTCGSVKKTRKFLEENGIEYGWNDFRVKAPSATRITKWVKALGAKALKNTSGGAYRALPAVKADWTDEQWIEAFTEDAMLIKRPVVEVDGTPAWTGHKAELLENL